MGLRLRLKGAKSRLIHGLQNTDYELVKQLAIEGWRGRFGKYLPAVYQVKHKMNLSAVAGSVIKQRALEAVQSTAYDAKIDSAVVKWREKAKIILGAVNASGETVAWIITAATPSPRL